MRGIATHRIHRVVLGAAVSVTLGLSAASAEAGLISPQAVARLRAIAHVPAANGREPAKPIGIVRGHKVG
jgi:hypothetical protein